MESQTEISSGPAHTGAASDVAFMRPAGRTLFTQVFMLPGGYVDDEGVVHREVELSPVTGFDEELLDSIGPAVCSAHVVTALLSRCLKRVGSHSPVTTSLVRDLLIHDRDFLMWKLRELTLGKRIRAMIVCGDPKCAQSMDIALNLDDVMPALKPVDRRVFTFDVSEDGETFEFAFRLPAGADQEACAEFVRDDPFPAVNHLLAQIVLRVNDNCSIDKGAIDALSPAILSALEQRIEELAPLASIDIEAACVECERPSVSPLDVTSFFLNELQHNQRMLEREVHFIAWHYHWPEREILALTRRKRRRYIDLIQGDSTAAFHADSIVATLPANS